VSRLDSAEAQAKVKRVSTRLDKTATGRKGYSIEHEQLKTSNQKERSQDTTKERRRRVRRQESKKVGGGRGRGSAGRGV
jgi:hypothetical protein